MLYSRFFEHFDNPPVRTFINKIGNIITFKIVFK